MTRQFNLGAARSPQWQRARFAASDDMPEIVGEEVWVRGRPNEQGLGSTDPHTGDDVAFEATFETNIHAGTQNVRAAACDLELLARDVSDFADVVEAVELDTWLAGIRERKATAS